MISKFVYFLFYYKYLEHVLIKQIILFGVLSNCYMEIIIISTLWALIECPA